MYGFVVVVVVVVVLVVLARYLLEFIANPVALLVLDLLILLEYFLRVFWYRIAVCSGITSSFSRVLIVCCCVCFLLSGYFLYSLWLSGRQISFPIDNSLKITITAKLRKISLFLRREILCKLTEMEAFT